MAYRLVAPGSVLDWSFDWTEWLLENDTIVSHAWSIYPADGPELIGPGNAKVVVRNLTAGHVYVLTDQITTAGGLTDSRSITLRCG